MTRYLADMAVTNVDLTWRGDSGELARKDGGQLLTLSHTDVYTVLVDNTPTPDTSFTVAADSNIPQPGSAHPQNAFLFVDKVIPRRTGPITFDVTVKYKTNEWDNDNGQNPINVPARYSYRTVKTEGEIDETVDGKLIQTAAGEKITGIRRSFSDLALEVTKNVLAFNPRTFWNYIDHVNSDVFHGFPPGTAYVNDLSANFQTYEDFGYWEISAVIIFRNPIRTSPSKAWYARTVHEGFYYKNSAGDIVRAKDDEDKDTVVPVKLSTSGGQLALDAEPNWLEFKILADAAFNGMGFGV